MSNSALVNCTIKSPNHSGVRNHSVDRITPHCVVGQLSVESIGSIFVKKSRNASCNYAIGSDGRVLLCVDEKNRSWCSSSKDNDHRAITIECASDLKAPYAMNSKVYNKLVELCVDICKRYNKKKLLWFNDKNKSLNYKPAGDEMVITVHRWFSNTACPGDWLYSHLEELAKDVTSKLGGSAVQKPTQSNQTSSFKVKINTASLNVRKGAGTSFPVVTTVHRNEVYTIVETQGSWGKLKSGAGWISLNYTKRV